MWSAWHTRVYSPLIILATVFTAAYMVIAPNVMRPLVKKVTGTDSFSIAHPTTTLSVLAAGVAKVTGDPSKSTEDLKFPKGLNFLREVAITSSIVILLTYLVCALLLNTNGYVAAEILGYDKPFTYFFTKTINFGTGVTIMLMGVRMLIAEIVPAFQGIATKVVPGAIPALDCPVIFNIAPNLMRPLVKKVTGTDSSSIAHPTTTLSLLAAGVAKLTGDPSKSTEDLKFPQGLNFLR